MNNFFIMVLECIKENNYWKEVHSSHLPSCSLLRYYILCLYKCEICNIRIYQTAMDLSDAIKEEVVEVITAPTRLSSSVHAHPNQPPVWVKQNLNYCPNREQQEQENEDSSRNEGNSKDES